MISLPFLAARRTGGDQPNAVVPTGMGDHDHRRTLHLPDADIAVLAVVLAVVEPSQEGGEDELQWTAPIGSYEVRVYL